jgi:hypothetical protein
MARSAFVRESGENKAAGIQVPLINSNLRGLYSLIGAARTGLAAVDLTENAGNLSGDVVNNYCWMDFYVTAGSFKAGETLPAACLYTPRALTKDPSRIVNIPANIADASDPPVILNSCRLLYIRSKHERVMKNGLPLVKSEMVFSVFRQPPAALQGGGAVRCSLYIVL